MLPQQNPTQTQAWEALSNHYDAIQHKHLRELFATDPQRFEKFSLRFSDLLLDYSKNRITEETMELLLQLARSCGVEEALEAMFSGKKINSTEGRAVLHTALRYQGPDPIVVDGQDVVPEVKAVLERMYHFADRLQSGEWKGKAGGYGIQGPFAAYIKEILGMPFRPHFNKSWCYKG